MLTTEKQIEDSYKYCLKLAKDHYENFPVASVLLPKKIRLPIAAIYAFARQADDFSDEGNLSDIERLEHLTNCEKKLKNIRNYAFHDNNDKIYTALKDTIYNFNLPINLFLDLIKAFKQDVTKSEYQDFGEVLDYCKNSANPVGRLLLHLTNNDSQENLVLSDNICTSLQLINFLQDIYSDAVDRNRCYMPLDDMQKYGFSLDLIKQKYVSQDFSKFITEQINRAKKLMDKGKPLERKLTGIFGIEIRLIILGGETIIQALYNRRSIYDRPTINKLSWLNILIKSLFK